MKSRNQLRIVSITITALVLLVGIFPVGSASLATGAIGSAKTVRSSTERGVKRGAGQLLLSRWGAFSMLHPRLFHLKKVIDFKET
jgi:hypothetical protein